MNSGLDEAYAILDDFEKEVAKVEKDSTDLHRMWLHRASELYERFELEKWMYGEFSNTEASNSLAQDAYNAFLI